MIVLSVPGSVEFKELATRAVSTACKFARIRNADANVSLPEEFTYEMVSAVGEAFNNVVLHGYQNLSAGLLVLEITTLDDRMEIVMKDFGLSFNPDDAPEPDLGSLPESGMGLFIMRAFVDELTYEPGSPNCLRMVKHYASWREGGPRQLDAARKSIDERLG